MCVIPGSQAGCIPNGRFVQIDYSSKRSEPDIRWRMGMMMSNAKELQVNAARFIDTIHACTITLAGWSWEKRPEECVSENIWFGVLAGLEKVEEHL